MTLRLVPYNFFDDATLATELAPVDGFSIENTKDVERSRVWRSTGSADQYVSWTFDDDISRTASFFGFFRHRCHGGNVRFVLYSDAGWSSIAYDSGTNATIKVIPTDGYNWGFDAYGGSGLDPYLTESPYYSWFTPTAHKSGRAYFSGNVGTYGYAYWQVCRFFLGKYFEPSFTAQYGAMLKAVSQSDRNRSRGGSLRTNIGPRWKESVMDLIRIPDVDRKAWLDIQERLGVDRDFVLSLFAGAGTVEERDNTVNCMFSAPDALERWFPGYLKRRIQIEEV